MLRTSLLVAGALCVFAQDVMNVPTNAPAKRVAVSNGVAYLADSTYGLTIANKDRVLGGLEMVGDVRDVAVMGDMAFTVGVDGLVKVDVTDSANPTQTGVYAFSTRGQRLTVAGNYAFIASDTDGLLIVDVTTMTLVSQYHTTGTLHRFTSVVVQGDYAFISDYTMGLIILNIANKAAPTHVATLYIPTAFDVDIMENTVYVASYTSGLFIVDVSNKMVPVRLSIFGTSQNLVGLSVSESGVVLAAGELYFVNVEDAVMPIGSTYTLPTGTAADVEFYMGMVYVAANNGGLVVVPQSVAVIPPPATPSPPVPVPGSSSDDDLTETAIAAIVVGCVVFVAIIVTIVVLATSPAKVEIEGDEVEEEPVAEEEPVVENNEPIEA